MSKFQSRAYYEQSRGEGYKLLPFNFARLNDEKYVATNLVGERVILARNDLEDVVKHRLAPSNPLYDVLQAKHFISNAGSNLAEELLALKWRTKLKRLSEFTGLHIFVVTLRCEHSCPYCQVSRQSDDKLSFDMSAETAERSLQLVFKSPSPNIKIEFQGGEPLLNFDRIKHVVRRAIELNKEFQRNIEFVIATNLALLDDEVLSFCKEHNVLISTSLDGPEDLHNRNRPRPGRDSYQRAIAGIERARSVLGSDRVSALMTTTSASLDRVTDIIDEYVARDFLGIFLRPLSPYGFAVKTKAISSYGEDAWIEFYKKGVDYILKLNERGIPFTEQLSAIILNKMLTPVSDGYVDLMNPAGVGIAVLVYNYDGDVYASDEGRMLAEMGDKSFRLGSVHHDSHDSIIFSEPLLEAIEQSFTLSAPMCCECAFEPFCGAEPVYHRATQKDFVGRKPLSAFCRRSMEVCKFLLERMEHDPFARKVFLKWVRR